MPQSETNSWRPCPIRNYIHRAMSDLFAIASLESIPNETINCWSNTIVAFVQHNRILRIVGFQFFTFLFSLPSKRVEKKGFSKRNKWIEIFRIGRKASRATPNACNRWISSKSVHRHLTRRRRVKLSTDCHNNNKKKHILSNRHIERVIVSNLNTNSTTNRTLFVAPNRYADDLLIFFSIVINNNLPRNVSKYCEASSSVWL